jgi:hypothetical protein
MENSLEQWFKAIIKIETEDDKGRTKVKKEAYIVSAITPTDVEAKLAKHLSMSDYEVVAISTQNIIDIVK